MTQAILDQASPYIVLLQVAAVTVVACVLILGAGSDIYSLDPTGGQESGGGRPVLVQRYKGFRSSLCRLIAHLVVGFLAITYTLLLSAIIYSTIGVQGYFSVRTLSVYFVFVVSVTIMAVCWFSYLALALKRKHMLLGGTHS